MRTVRFEVLVKEAYWVVAPMEIRIQEARVPEREHRSLLRFPFRSNRSPDGVAWEALLTAFTGANRRSLLRRPTCGR